MRLGTITLPIEDFNITSKFQYLVGLGIFTRELVSIRLGFDEVCALTKQTSGDSD